MLWQGAENGPRGKLTHAQIAEIRQRYEAGGVFYKELAAEYGVTAATICRALRGRTYHECQKQK
jgi:Mor family transcriptional regulator